MKQFMFIPTDRTKAAEGATVVAQTLSEAILLLWPDGAADSNKAFYKREWSVFSVDLTEVL